MIFFLNDTATTEIYTLSLHDALPIWPAGAGAALPLLSPTASDGRRGSRRGVRGARRRRDLGVPARRRPHRLGDGRGDRKSTRLNSSHANISYAVFCLKKKK